ncbi:LysR family transcriptional regulator [Lacrimispora sp. 210928-DFI.3.58]|uniref:LysR family transcriptional regulator n=1 Tax=Lacrimispora sp. 210928-DFI.3.58 TaxID=2883214 RepID=UPI001D08543C|nr:LysR family transcriptional regulator [Lacrimispora sp. 210928-DFI.3.58]MCB7319336.1 LysR family transcriptional regulator [Lacrimispora sp. 210928-DFI.3.58]
MRLTQLQYFLSVYEHQNITRAAEELHISQPSITTALKELENEYHVNLFHRINKKMYLTEEGQLFYTYATKILKDVEELEDSIRDITGNRNRIKLGLPLQVGAFLLPLLIGDFRSLYPQISLELVECGAMDIINRLLQEELDIAIAFIENDSTLLNQSPLFETEICFCVSYDHPLAEKKQVTFQETCEYPTVMFSDGSYTHKRIFRMAEKEGCHPKVELYTKQLHTIINLISNSAMGSYLIREAVMFNEDIVSIPFAEPLTITVNTITKKNRLIYKDTKALIEFIKKEYEKKTGSTSPKQVL